MNAVDHNNVVIFDDRGIAEQISYSVRQSKNIRCVAEVTD